MFTRARTVEALVLMTVAAVLIAFLPFRFWRGSLGEQGCDEVASPQGLEALGRQVRSAVDRASGRAHGRFACLPRAMAAQWMFRRRSCPSTLVFGVRRGENGRLQDLHAWVEVDREIVVGAVAGEPYTPSLRLVQR